MKNKKDIIIVLIILFTFIQGVIFIRLRINTKEKSNPVISEIKNEPTYIKDIDESLSDLKNYNIINRKKDGDQWIINIKLSGSKEEILFNLNKLDTYIIKNYNIGFNNNNCEVNLELKSK